MLQFHGEQKGTALVRQIVGNLKPVLTDGRLAMARSVAAGEYLFALNNFVNLTLNVKLAGGPIEFMPLDPVPLYFAQVAVNARAPQSERRAARRQLHAQPGMPDILHQVRPAADARRRADQSARHRRGQNRKVVRTQFSRRGEAAEAALRALFRSASAVRRPAAQRSRWAMWTRFAKSAACAVWRWTTRSRTGANARNCTIRAYKRRLDRSSILRPRLWCRNARPTAKNQ